MIRIRPVPLEACDSAYLAPFVERYGSLPVTQAPRIARVLAEGARLDAYAFSSGDKPAGYALVTIRRRILADISFGPVVLDNDDYIECVDALKRQLRAKGLMLLRILPPYNAPRPAGIAANFNWATSIIDISKGEEDILKSFSPNHRQSIRKAAAAGIRVQELGPGGAAAYAEGHVAMFASKGIRRNMADTRRLVNEFQAIAQESAGTEVFLLSASLAGSEGIIGGGIFLRSGDTCMYYHGYAHRPDPPLPVLHLLLWEAMKQAKSLGCSRFDLAGYSLDTSDLQLKAVNDFKRWFRGEILHYPPTVVIPLYAALKPLLRLIGKRI
jgi:lipid II:glycine glycyltransferase (peptidoglycan interpeptide bridge formation enzyme)